jgi:L-2-hydroxyglutarate oxidase LhgO
MDRVSITIVGAGVIGCAVAYELSRSGVQDILVVERNPRVKGDNQSSRNSGVIHAGIYYNRVTQPFKARFCVEGNRLLYDFCRQFGVPHRRTGKLVVAVSEDEKPYLDEVRADAEANGVPGVQELDGRRLKELEPNVRGIKALYFPTTGLVEPTEFVGALERAARARGAVFLTGNTLTRVAPQGDGFAVDVDGRSGRETFATGLLINAAGLYSDEVARLVDPESPYRILPIRGEWARFTKDRRPELVLSERSIYPAPYGCDNATGERVRAAYGEYRRLLGEGCVSKTIGIHLSPTFDRVRDEYVVGRTVIVGPTYVVDVDKEDYAPSNPESYYLDKVQPFFPGIRLEDLELHSTGIRAKPAGRSDFLIERSPKHPRCLNLVGIDSPGLTASLAIARYVRDMLRD